MRVEVESGPAHKERKKAKVAAMRRHPLRGLCRGCGAELVETHRPTSIYCSKPCYDRTGKREAARAGRPSARRVRALRALERARRGTSSSRLWVFRPCVVCSTTYVTPHGATTCSDLCRSKLDRDRVRESARRKRSRIVERDGWICQVCQDEENPTVLGDDPNAAEYPVVDHWIPLAAGEPDPNRLSNLVIAHRLCNEMKADHHPDELGLVRRTKEVTR